MTTEAAHVCNFRSPWPIGHPLPPVNPDKTQGLAAGAFALYQYKNNEPEIVRIIDNSYVWSPGECRHKGGYRRYDWSVIERGPNGYRSIVVSDSDLTPIPEDQRVHAIYAIQHARGT